MLLLLLVDRRLDVERDVDRVTDLLRLRLALLGVLERLRRDLERDDTERLLVLDRLGALGVRERLALRLFFDFTLRLALRLDVRREVLRFTDFGVRLLRRLGVVLRFLFLAGLRALTDRDLFLTGLIPRSLFLLAAINCLNSSFSAAYFLYPLVSL